MDIINGIIEGIGNFFSVIPESVVQPIIWRAKFHGFLENDLEISDGLSNSREFNYETPIIYEEDSMENGRFMVYGMNIENPDFPGTLTLFELDWDLREKDEAKMEADKK